MHITAYGLFIKATGILKAIGIIKVYCRYLRLNQEFIGITEELFIEFFQFTVLAFFCIQEVFLVMTQFLRLQDGIRLTEFSLGKILLCLFETFGIDFNFTERPGKAKHLLLEILQLPSFFLQFFAFIEPAYCFIKWNIF